MNATTVQRDSLFTLNYRVSAGDDTEITSTVYSTLATLQLRSGELVPTL